MSNHYHLVVKIEPERTKDWNDQEVLERWTSLFNGPLLVQQAIGGRVLSSVEQQSVDAAASVYRERLGSLSWFMKCLNEPIARRANSEDGCTGHFWEARFHSQALCSERSLLAAMAYVDLNPIRAGMARSLESSDYTSVQARIKTSKDRDSSAQLLQRGELRHLSVAVRPLMPFANDKAAARDDVIPISREDYLNLLEQTARIAVQGKRGLITLKSEAVLLKLGLSSLEWLCCATAFDAHFRNGDLRLKVSA